MYGRKSFGSYPVSTSTQMISKIFLWLLSSKNPYLHISKCFKRMITSGLNNGQSKTGVVNISTLLSHIAPSGEASSSQSQMAQADPDDIFLNIQRASSITKSIYFDFYSLSKGEFIRNVKDLGNEIELKFVRDMVTAIVRRRTGFTGNTVERKKCDGLKEKLASDIYLMFAFGEGSIQSLPKHILKSDGRSTSDQSSQTNIDSYFAQKDELNALRVELMSKIEEIKKTLLKAPEESSQNMPEQPSHECSMFTDSVMTKSMYDANPVDAMSRSLPRNRAKSSPTTPLQPTEPEANSNSIKVIFIGDSLLHRMNTEKMNVGNIPGIKLTKPGDTLEGSVCRARDYLSKHCDQVCNIVLLAGTNDLHKRKCSPKSLLEALDDSINELKSFSNLQDIFLVKLPPRCDIASVNHKVNIYNQLLDDHFINIESVSIIDTVPLENRFLYKDGLHLSDLGLDKQCRIILSILYRKLAPELKRERTKRKSNSTKHRPRT